MDAKVVDKIYIEVLKTPAYWLVPRWKTTRGWTWKTCGARCLWLATTSPLWSRRRWELLIWWESLSNPENSIENSTTSTFFDMSSKGMLKDMVRSANTMIYVIWLLHVVSLCRLRPKLVTSSSFWSVGRRQQAFWVKVGAPNAHSRWPMVKQVNEVEEVVHVKRTPIDLSSVM